MRYKLPSEIICFNHIGGQFVILRVASRYSIISSIHVKSIFSPRELTSSCSFDTKICAHQCTCRFMNQTFVFIVSPVMN